MPTLTIEQRVPFLGVQGETSMRFSRWIPDEGSPIELRDGSLVACGWTDASCVESFAPVSVERLASWVNIPVGALLVRVTVDDVGPDLAEFIQDNADWPRKTDPRESADPATKLLAREYETLGHGVYDLTIRVVNRLVEWAYAEKGQYWLSWRMTGHEHVSSRNNEFGSRVSVEGRSPVRWCPPNTDTITLYGDSGQSSITRDDWPHVVKFCEGQARAWLAGELLSNALALLSDGHLRGAVTEAISALEVAINQFARSPREDVLREIPIPPYSQDALKKTVEHLSFSTTLRHLLPLILNPALLDGSGHQSACDLLDVRQTIVHSGQRRVDETRVRAGIQGVRLLVALLANGPNRNGDE